MKIERIVIDLDDVLNYNVRDVMRLMGVDIDSTYGNYPNQDVCVRTAVAECLDEPVQDVKTFWDKVPRELWSDAECSHECYDILEWAMMQVGADNVLIATSPTKCPQCMAGKHDWIQRCIPRQLQRNYSVTPRKWWLRRPDTLLLDDQETNCQRFHDEPFAGHAIAIPRPWNWNRGKDVMTTIKETYAEIQW